jgi:nucleotide-binding universal stress UspA family protein
MTGFRRICCPVDFSGPSRVAMEEGARLARREGASLTVLYVEPAAPAGLEGPFVVPPAPHAASEAGKLEAWREYAERILGAPVGSVILGAPVADAITGYARDTGTDLIVLSTHGRTGLRRAVLGSVAEAVLRHAPCPVLAFRAPPDPVEPEDLAARVPP